MTELLEQAIERVRALPPETQDDFARVLLRLAGEDEAIHQLTPDEEADLAAADAEIARGEFASEAEVEAVFSKYRL
jgi:hypothetical protein